MHPALRKGPLFYKKTTPSRIFHLFYNHPIYGPAALVCVSVSLSLSLCLSLCLYFSVSVCLSLKAVCVHTHCLQCFDAVGWAAGRASGL